MLSLALLLAVERAAAQQCSRTLAADLDSEAAALARSAQATTGRAEFERGVRAFREADWAVAMAAFSCAYELSSDYRLLYNMAQVEAARERHAAALRLLASYLGKGGQRIDSLRREEVEREQARLERHVAALQVTANVEPATLWIDGAYVGSLPSGVLWLDPGEHQLLVASPPHEPVRRSVTLLPGGRELLELRLGGMPPRTGSAREQAPAAMRTPLWISIGAAAASGGLAIAFSILTRAADAKLERELGRYPADQADLGAARSRVRTLSAVSDVALGASAVTASVAVYLALQASPASVRKRETRSLHIVPVGFGMGVRGAF